jgi:hypothetical protein
MMADDKQEEQNENEGYKLLRATWFSTIHELDSIMCNAEQTRDRIEAARVLVEYFKSMAQSINDPWVPERDPFENEDDEDEDDD